MKSHLEEDGERCRHALMARGGKAYIEEEEELGGGLREEWIGIGERGGGEEIAPSCPNLVALLSSSSLLL